MGKITLLFLIGLVGTLGCAPTRNISSTSDTASTTYGRNGQIQSQQAKANLRSRALAVRAAAAPASYGTIKSAQTGYCIDISGQSTAANAPAIQWPCNGQANELFAFVAASNGYQIVGKLSNLCLSLGSGGKIVQVACAVNANQIWKAVAVSGGYHIVNVSRNVCMITDKTSGSQVANSSCTSAVSRTFAIAAAAFPPAVTPTPTVTPTSMPTATPTPTPKPTVTPTPTPTPSGTPVVLPAPSTVPTSSWIGNSLPNATAGIFMQINIDAAYISPDGTVYTNTSWDEGSGEGGFYKNGNRAGSMAGTHGWGRLGGAAIAGDSKYIYMVISQDTGGGSGGTNSFGGPSYPSGSSVWYAVRRYDLLGNGKGYSKGYGYDGSMVLINTSTYPTGVASSGSKLYVSDPATNKILIYNLSDSAITAASSFSVSNPGSLAYDANSDSLWMIQKGTSNIIHYSSSGAVLGQVSVANPTALAVDNQGRLLVGDNGPDQNVKIFTNIESNPTLSASFGNVGGQYKTGIKAPLNFGGITGVGSDSVGNIYVAMNGVKPGIDSSQIISTDIRAFNSAGTLNWQLFSNSFVDTAVIDPLSDGTEVYSKSAHYKLDLSKPVGQQAIDYAVTQNPLKYPNDPRYMFGSGFLYPVGMRYINGQKFLFMFSMYQQGMVIYRFDGEFAVPSVWLGQANNGSAYPAGHPGGNWIWTDSSGDGDFQSNEFAAGDDSFNSFGMSVDSAGVIWSVGSKGVTAFAPQGVDAKGNPIYTAASMKKYAVPAGYSDVERVIHIAETDTLYIGGFPTGQTDGGKWGTPGSVLDRYDNFTTAPTKKFSLKTTFNATTGVLPKAVDVAGNAIFIQDGTSGNGDAGPGLMHVYDASTGIEKVNFYPGAAIGGRANNGWTDIPGAVHAYSLKSGRYLVFVEDDVHGKVFMYYW